MADSSDNDAGCGCAPSPDAQATRGAKAMILGALCVLGCLAGPLLIGGVAALGSVVTGEVWVAIAGTAVAISLGIVVKRRLR